MLITKADNTIEEFKPKKLVHSLMHAGASEAEAQHILSEIEKKLISNTTTREIYHSAFRLLKEEKKVFASRYSLRESIRQLGPTGFPFEDYMSALFTRKGYKTEVRQNLRGVCATHEIDVVGYNDTETFIAEAKFHKDHGFKSDLQVALYSYARFLDLKEKPFPFGNGVLDTLRIVTNTKFTSAAIEYSECRGIQLMSWGYPHKGSSLENEVARMNLYPITTLFALSGHQKTLLLSKGIVLCEDLVSRRAELEEFNIPRKVIESAVTEINELFRVSHQ